MAPRLSRGSRLRRFRRRRTSEWLCHGPARARLTEILKATGTCVWSRLKLSNDFEPARLSPSAKSNLSRDDP
ncbi:unnamed protein product [Lampetra planeri]